MRPTPPARSRAAVKDPGHAIRLKLPDWTYWEPIDTPIVGDAQAPDLPLTDAAIVRVGAAEARWTAAPASLREDVERQAFAVAKVTGTPRARLGAFYAALRDEHMPYVITIDTLFYLAHLALDRALAEVEERQLAPALDTVLTRLDMRLAAESRDARADLAPAYNVARGLIAVASALTNASYAPASDLVDVVAKEKALIFAHAGPSVSPLLAVAIDYSAMAPRGMADKNDARIGYFLAMAWLGQAPLMLAGNGEEGAAGKVSVAMARTHARAALMLSRLLDYDVDAEAAQAWERIERVSEFIAGPADDLTPHELARAAVEAGTDLKDARWLANVARVDHLRHVATKKHVTRLYDGAGGLRLPLANPGPNTDAIIRAAPSLRLIGGRDAPDGEVLQGLVFPMVGAMQARPTPPMTARDGERAVPTGLDIAAWLGSTEARLVLRETGDDAYQGYDAALERLYQRRPPEDAIARHASLYVSSLDALATYVAGSAGDGGQPGTISSAWRRRKIDVALGAWTALRHDAISFTRLPLTPTRTAEPPHAEATNDVPAFVEPHPEAIAKLLALVRQATRGLTAFGALPADSPARALLAEVDDLLWTSLGVALNEVNDQALTSDEAAALAAIPTRLVALEARVVVAGTADVPLAIDVHTDLGPARVLEEATGYIDDLYLVIPEPRTRRLVLAVGASIPHYEFVQPAAQRLSDTGWRARLAAGAPPQKEFVKDYLVAEPSRAAPTRAVVATGR